MNEANGRAFVSMIFPALPSTPSGLRSRGILAEKKRVSARLGSFKSGRGSSAHDRELGFTILELLFVLLIASLTATAAIPAYFSRSEVTLDNATRLLVDDLRQAQIRAVYRNAAVDVRFESSGDGYSVVDRCPETPADDEANLVVRRYSRDAVFEGVRVSMIPDGSAHAIEFESDGTTHLGRHVTLDYRGEARTVLVEAPRGTIRAPELEASPLRARR